ncbi:MAG TPA: MBL fold metallo-hydrolase, partial [Candidatus Krumholzibacterium sp.]|nr:MBL fold metallo-hydrolase [Candidatus Krumholzibacterium sp.]
MTRRILFLAVITVSILFAGCSGGDIDKTGLVKVADNVYAWIAAGPGAEYGLGANAGFVVGTDAVLVIDTRYTPDLAEELRDAIASVTDVPVRYVINTHYHPDHCWGNSVFAGPGVTIFSTPSTKDDIEKYTPVYLSYYREQRPDAYRQLVNVRMALPDSTFEERLELDLGGIKAEAYHLGPAHTAGDVFVSIPAARTVFSGGLVSNGYHPNMSDQGADYDNWKAILEKLATTGIDRIVPGQGKVTRMAALQAQVAYIDGIIDAGKAAIRNRKTMSEAATETVIPNTETYLQPNMLPFNMQAIYRLYSLEVVSPAFEIDLPTQFHVKDGEGDTARGRIMWTSQTESGYSELEFDWQPTRRTEVIRQDLHDLVGQYLTANQQSEMEIRDSKEVLVGDIRAIALYGRWGYARQSGQTGSGQWTWAMFLDDGTIYSVKMSTNAGKNREL